MLLVIIKYTLYSTSWFLWPETQLSIALLLYWYSATQSKNAVSINIKLSRYIHLMSNFSSIHFHTKRLYVHMFDIVDTPFSYRRQLIVCSSLQEFSKTKESTMHVIWNVDTAFLLCGADILYCISSRLCHHLLLGSSCVFLDWFIILW